MTPHERRFLDAQPRIEAVKRVKRQHSERRRNLRDPNFGLHRTFPVWSPEMSASTYVRLFQALNRHVKDEQGLTFVFPFKSKP